MKHVNSVLLSVLFRITLNDNYKFLRFSILFLSALKYSLKLTCIKVNCKEVYLNTLLIKGNLSIL